MRLEVEVVVPRTGISRVSHVTNYVTTLDDGTILESRRETGQMHEDVPGLAVGRRQPPPVAG